MMAGLMGMDVSNASLYDGASALAEAVLMAVRCQPQVERPAHPAAAQPCIRAYRQVVRSIVGPQGVDLVELPFDLHGGHTAPESLEAFEGQDMPALIVPQPNFFGVLEEVDALTDWAHRQRRAGHRRQSIRWRMALLRPPGEWGAHGADIACGEGQPLGVPLSSGGPYFGFMCCRQEHVRQMPGRIIGRTLDRPGPARLHAHPAGARAAHPPLQGYLEHLHQPGSAGDRRDHLHGAARPAGTGARRSRLPRQYRRAHRAALCIAGREPLLRPARCSTRRCCASSCRCADCCEPLSAQESAAGYELTEDYPELGNALLVCATETKSRPPTCEPMPGT